MEDKQNKSPVPMKVQMCSFPRAMVMVIEGKEVTRLSWNDPKERCAIRNGWLMICRKRDDTYEWFTWQINDGDMLGDDWMVIQFPS